MARKGNNIYLRNTGKWEGRYIREQMPDGRIRYGYVSGKTRYNEILQFLTRVGSNHIALFEMSTIISLSSDYRFVYLIF